MTLATQGYDIRWRDGFDFAEGDISLRDYVWSPLGGQIRSVNPTNPSERHTYIPRDISIGTINEVMRVISPTVQPDTFLDDEVGDTIRRVKENFGDAPLINAYEAALATSKESDKKWKEYWEEEARMQSLFEED